MEYSADIEYTQELADELFPFDLTSLRREILIFDFYADNTRLTVCEIAQCLGTTSEEVSRIVSRGVDGNWAGGKKITHSRTHDNQEDRTNARPWQIK